MNILLVRPPDPFGDVNLLSHTKPLNLAYIAAYMLNKGFSVKIVDYEIDRFTQRAFHQLLSEYKPAVLGVSCMTPTIKNGAAVCLLAKQYDRNIITVVGGAHANGLPERTLHEFPVFDYLVYGEGEASFHELCSQLKARKEAGGVDGIVYRDGGKIIKNPPRKLIDDLDSIPFPARNLLADGAQAGHSSRGFSNAVRSAEIFTSRGCPYGCAFCAIQTAFGRRVRFRNTRYIEDEIKECVKKYGYNHIIIADDTFTLNRDRAFAICDIIAGSGASSWSCDTHVNTVTKELLAAMKKSGCQKVAFGVESGSKRIIDLIGKRITFEQVENAVRWAKEAGIKHIEGNFIIGSDPSETIADVKKSKRLITSLPWSFVSVAIIVPYPGTPVYAKMIAENLIEAEDWEDFVMFGKVPKWRTESFSPEELVRLQKELTRSFYLNPPYIFKQIMGIRSWKDVRYWLTAGFSYLKWYFTGKVN